MRIVILAKIGCQFYYYLKKYIMKKEVSEWYNESRKNW